MVGRTVEPRKKVIHIYIYSVYLWNADDKNFYCTSTEETLQKVKHETQTTQDTLSPEFIKDTRKFTTEYTPDFQYGNEISSVFG